MSLAVMLYALLLLSCSSNDEQKPPAAEVTRICVYKDTRTCYSTTQTTCPAGGELSDFCPYEGSNVASSPSVVPSSNSAVPSSPSVVPSSSSAIVPSSSSQSVVPSSSSKPIDGVECEGYCKWNDGCVRIATDPKGVREPGKSLPPITSCDDAILNCKNYSPTGNVFSNSTCDIVVITPSSSSVVQSSSSPNNIGDYCNWYGDAEGSNCWPIKNEIERKDCGSNVVVACPNGGPKSSSSAVASSSSIAPSSSSIFISQACTPKDNTNKIYCSNGTTKEYGFVTHDGKSYKTVVIGTQTWMTEDLFYTGWTNIMDLASLLASQPRVNCDETTCASYISAKHRGRCPEGYHIPSRADWDKLVSYVGGTNAGNHLKAINGDWFCSECSCDDTYGFSAQWSEASTLSYDGGIYATTEEIFGDVQYINSPVYGNTTRKEARWFTVFIINRFTNRCNDIYYSSSSKKWNYNYIRTRCLKD